MYDLIPIIDNILIRILNANLDNIDELKIILLEINKILIFIKNTINFNKEKRIIGNKIFLYKNQIKFEIYDNYLHNLYNNFYEKNSLARKKLSYYNLKNIQKKCNVEKQKSDEWLIRRNGFITASNVATIIEKNKYKSYDEYLFELCGLSDKFDGNEATKFGETFEPIAIQIYMNELNKSSNTTKYTFLEAGLVPHSTKKYPFLAASPDGLILEKKYNINEKTKQKSGVEYRDGFIIEVKCPLNRKPNGKVPDSYLYQIQTQLEVCNVEKCVFLDFKFFRYFIFDNFAACSYNYIYKGYLIKIDNKTIDFEIYDKNSTYEQIKIDLNKKINEKYSNNKICIEYWNISHKYYINVLRNRDLINKIAPKLAHFWSELSYFKQNFCELLDDNDFLLDYQNKKINLSDFI